MLDTSFLQQRYWRMLHWLPVAHGMLLLKSSLLAAPLSELSHQGTTYFTSGNLNNAQAG